MSAPALVRARVAHRRTRPFTYAFTTSTPMWLVDVADPDAAFPRWLRWLASVRPADHLAPDDHRPLAAKVRAYLDDQDVSWTAHRVLLLANARSLGYVFDPLSTYFCLDEAGRLEGVIAEVHNTYGQRHCYPLAATSHPGIGVDTLVDKDFYVSPFFAVEGRYDIRTRLSDSRVLVAISLTQDERCVFTASVQGDLEPATRGRVLRALVRYPLPSQRVSLLIRWHGIKLWLRRLPVIPRPAHQAPKGITHP